MPVSPSGVSGISAYHFRTCRSFDELWILRVWLATFKYQTGRKSRNPRTPSTMQACSSFSNPFLKSCFSNPTFSSTILVHNFAQVFYTLKIAVHCFGTRHTLKKVICLILSSALVLLLCHFHNDLNIQNSSPTPTWLSTYHWQFSTCNHFHAKLTTNPSLYRFPGWPRFFQQQVFPFVPSMVDFKCTVIFRNFHLDFLCAN